MYSKTKIAESAENEKNLNFPIIFRLVDAQFQFERLFVRWTTVVQFADEIFYQIKDAQWESGS